MKIIGYMDFFSTSFKEQIETASKLQIDDLILRKIDDRFLYENEELDYKEIIKELRIAKKNIIALDPLIYGHELFDLEKYNQNLEKYMSVFEVANKLKVNYVFFRIPKFTDILTEFDEFEKQMMPIFEASKKNNVTLVFNQEKEKTNTLVYILKKYKKKKITVSFNPKTMVLVGDSPTTSYRLLKNDFKFFVAADVDKKNNPELLGYGRTKIIDIFKKLNRDNYDSYVILDESFSSFIRKNTEKKVPWFKKLFKKNDFNNYLRGYSLRIFPNEEKEADIIDIYLNQIKALNVVFKNFL